MKGSIRIAIASGKGGTGKTTIATNLAVTLAEAGIRTAYADCDVEEPNGHLFLRPLIERSREVAIQVPAVNEKICSLCGDCGRACRYSAILALPKKVLTFAKLCHGCGGCTLACPESAIREVPRVTGIVEEGKAGQVLFFHGKLNVGEAMAPPVIRAVLAATATDCTTVIDAPPGTSCPVIESVKTADVVLLVTEPTPFGLNDLKLAVQMVQELGIPFGVAINRAGVGDNAVLEYCAEKKILVLLEIPDSRQIAYAYSRGELAVEALPELKPVFRTLCEKLHGLALGAKPKPADKPVQVCKETLGSKKIPSQLVESNHQSQIRELVVISGKGGTGKTSIVASFFALAEQACVSDCDVDAADLHLVLAPNVRQCTPFVGGQTAMIERDLCSGCGACSDHCRFGAIHPSFNGANSIFKIDNISCEGCGVCVDVCPERAATLVSEKNGEWYVSDTRHGPMVHARLGIAQENSGKLVSLVRREARAVAQLNGRQLLICDGSPGIGCPVIASITGAHMVLVVTEPTLSGQHDLGRVAELCRQFKVKAATCINKADINPEIAAKIEADATRLDIPLLGNIRYDEAVTRAQVNQLSVVENGDSLAAADIRALWERVRCELK